MAGETEMIMLRRSILFCGWNKVVKIWTLMIRPPQMLKTCNPDGVLPQAVAVVMVLQDGDLFVILADTSDHLPESICSLCAVAYVFVS
jgi:hypothetical protein